MLRGGAAHPRGVGTKELAWITSVWCLPAEIGDMATASNANLPSIRGCTGELQGCPMPSLPVPNNATVQPNGWKESGRKLKLHPPMF